MNPQQKLPFVVSAHLHDVPPSDAVELVFAPPPASRARILHFAHAHALWLARRDPLLAGSFARADAVFPDGIGVRLASRILGSNVRHNVNGTDLLPLLCERAVRESWPLVLVGGAEGVAALCAAHLCRRYPRLSVPIATHGFGSHDESVRVADAIASLGRVLVLVGMGSPLQELWTHRYLAQASGATALTVGGLFDFYSGRMRRAPFAVRALRCEWMFRLALEPRRLSRRYLVGGPAFLGTAVWDRVTGRITRAGAPTATMPRGTTPRTTLAAPTKAPAPTSAPARIVTPLAMTAPSPMRVPPPR